MSAHKTEATQSIRSRLDANDTGRLQFGNDRAAITVYLMQGRVVGAQSQDDIRRLLQRLQLAGALSPEQVQELQAMAEMNEPVLGQLLDQMPEDTLANLLREVFLENLTRAVGHYSKPVFTHLPAVFPVNYQQDSDSRQVIETCCDRWNAAATIDLSGTIETGTQPPATPLQKRLLGELRAPTSVSAWLAQIPVEAITARAMLRELIEGGQVKWVKTSASPRRAAYTIPPFAAEPFERSSDASSGDASSSDASSTGPGLDATPVDPPASGQASETEEEETLEIEGSDDSDRRKGAGNLSSLGAWMNHGVDLQADLDAFGDYDSGREAGEGSFSTENHNLDRVEVADLSEDSGLLAVGEAPEAKYSAPMLSEDDALAKVSVTNEVLLTVAKSFDDSFGAGRGQATIQLLLDGGPHQWHSLFERVAAKDTGELPEDDLLTNLSRRPPTEQRTLLQQGLLNLIDRALSVACDELPDEAVDRLLEDTVGYRQRIGI